MNGRPPRELTREERREIKKLVVSMCANYDRQYGCLPLDYGRCYMIDKCWTGGMCKYFREAVLPLNPALEAALTDADASTAQKECPICGTAYIPTTSQAYCSEACRIKGQREDNRKRQQKRRQKRS